MSDGESVKVAVRVRPFNARFCSTSLSIHHDVLTLINKSEVERGAKLCIEMVGKATTIWDVNEPERTKKTFAFDYSYWSHDGFHLDDTGLSIPDNDHYADQKRVFADLGQGVLTNAFAGLKIT